MSIKKLIDELQKLDPNLPVIIPDVEYEYVVNPILQRLIQTIGAQTVIITEDILPTLPEPSDVG